MAKKKATLLRTWVPEEQEKLNEIFKHVPEIEVDVGKENGLPEDKPVISTKVIWNDNVYWKAIYKQYISDDCTGIFWTDNSKDPKIINHATGKGRGNVNWRAEGGNPSGKPKGTLNRISAKDACAKLGANPADFLAAVMVGDIPTLKKHRVYDAKNITLAQKIKCAETLLKKMVPDLKPAELGIDGEAAISPELQQQEERSQLQVYIPSSDGGDIPVQVTQEEKEQIELAGGVEAYMKEHEAETVPYDKDDEEGAYVWRVD